MFGWLLSACGIKDKLPEGPAIDAWERTRAFGAEQASGADYTGRARVGFPVLPVQIWGATYDVDLVVVSKHPAWNMHEIAMLRTPRGPVWLAKDAREATMAQSIVADLDAIHAWMPEIPLQRKSWPVEVDDRSTAERIDLSIRYENIDGEPVAIDYEGPSLDGLQRKRNGSTFGHSQDQVLAVLDVSHREFGRRARVSIGGERVGVERLAGLIPFRMVLRQTQGGLAITDLLLEPGHAWQGEPTEREVVGTVPPEAAAAGGAGLEGVPVEGFTGTWATPSGHDVRAPWEVVRSDRYVDVFQRGDLRTLHYRFRIEGDAWELLEADVWQWGQPSPAMHLRLAPALPDLRRPFEGTHTSRYVIDVGGQQNHAVGTLTARWTDDGPVVDLAPEAPWWTADRPMRTTVTYEEDGVRILVERTSTD